MYGMNRTFFITTGHLTLQHSIRLTGARNLLMGMVPVRLQRSGVLKPANLSKLPFCQAARLRHNVVVCRCSSATDTSTWISSRQRP